MENKIKVELNNNSYDILVGSGAISALDGFLGNKYSKIFIISDEEVAKIHLATLKNELKDHITEDLIIKSGESSKSFDNFQEVCEKILSKNVDRKSLIIALGGGVVGDLAGFVASVILRGIDFIQVPTTLLSAVDSSVGGKTAINSNSGKNLIGSFYQPKLVLCDLNFLKTLPKRQIIAGYAEILKYGLIEDQDFFEFLEKNYQKLLDLDEEVLMYSILKSCEVKAKIVSMDEKEKGLRALLNFGHTFAHSLEKEVGYDGRLNHGEAVGIGMSMASRMSKNLGFLPSQDFERIQAHIQDCGLDIDLKSIKNDWDLNRLVDNLYKDKKSFAGKLNFVLIDRVGRAFVEKDVDEQEFVKVVRGFV